MNSLALAQRACRHLKVSDLAGLPVDEAAHVMDAINAALGEYCDSLPADQRISPASERVRAPMEQTISIVSGAKSFAYVAVTPYPAGGYASEAAALGMCVLVAGDMGMNRLARPGELLKPYTGSSGDRVATFYGDAVQMTSLMQSVRGPVFWQSGSGEPRELNPWHANLPARGGSTEKLNIGQPEYWSAESWERADLMPDVAWLLRLWPLPSASGTLTFTLETGFQPLRMADMMIARSLPIAESDAAHVVALVHEGLLTSPLLRENAPAKYITQAAERARQAFSIKRARRHFGVPNRVGTPQGF